MPPLANARHELFVRRVAAGEPQESAYRAVYVRAREGLAGARADELMQRPEVQARLAELRREAGQGGVFDLPMAVAYLTEILETPAGEITEGHRLCQEYTRTERAGTVTERVKMPGKLEALEKMAKILGWGAKEASAEERGGRLHPAVEEALRKVLGKSEK